MKFFTATAAALLGASVAKAQTYDPTATLYANIGADPVLSTLTAAIDAAGLDAALNDPAADPLTIFTPGNLYFAELDQDYLTLLLTPEFSLHLTNLLLFHVVGGSVLSTDISVGQEITMANEEILTVIDLNNDGNLWLSSVPPGSRIFPGGVDRLSSNGVTHLLEGVLLPSFVYTTFTELGSDFSTLAALLVQTNLDIALQNAQKVTVFAPTNAAFAALGDAAPTEDCVIAAILSYHAAGSVVTSDDIETGTITLTTLNGATLTVNKNLQDVVTVGGSAVVTAFDGLVNNGVYHTIDTVLFPPAYEACLNPDPENPDTSAAFGMSVGGAVAAAAAVAMVL
jgi:transforming growth factor-beta-induced protein